MQNNQNNLFYLSHKNADEVILVIKSLRNGCSTKYDISVSFIKLLTEYDFAVPGDSRIEEKEKDKIEKYQDLGRELQKIWNVKVKIIPLVAGSLGATPKQFGNRLKQIGIAVGTAQVQKTVLLGTVRILRKVLEI